MDASQNELSARVMAKVAASVAILTGTLLLGFPMLAWYGHYQSGSDGLVAAVVAALICWLAASIALLVAGVLRGPEQGINGVMLGILFGTGLPLGAGLFLSTGDTPLAKADFFKMILFFYLFTLCVKTTLMVRLVQLMERMSKAS